MILIYKYICGPFESFVYYLLVISVDLAYMALGKLAYADPRPYFVDKDIKAFVCEKQFGNPSGHSSGTAVLVVTVFLDVFHG